MRRRRRPGLREHGGAFVPAALRRQYSVFDLESMVLGRLGPEAATTTSRFAHEFLSNLDAVPDTGADLDEFDTDGLVTRPADDVVRERVQEHLDAGTDAADAEMPTLADLEAPYKRLRERRQVELEAAKSYQAITRVNNSITDTMFRNSIAEKVAQHGVDMMEAGSDVLLKIIFFSLGSDSHEQEVIVLASQTLADLAQVVVCRVAELAPGLSERLPSACFCIESQFYDDVCRQGASSISDPILEWATAPHRKVHPGFANVGRGPPTHRAVLNEIKLRVGACYFYLHLGGCRHTFMITDMRVLDSTDELNRVVYPLQTKLHRLRRQFCGVCRHGVASLVTYSDRLTPNTPFFFCDKCYHALHYTKKGELLYDDYKVFPIQVD